MDQEKPDIRDCPEAELYSWLEQQSEKTFRAKQIYNWLWQHDARSFDEMTNLPLALREKLMGAFALHKVDLSEKQVSNDGTIKCAFKVGEKQVVEGVLIPAGDRMTACISSQVGCSLACTFCATGKLKRMRNLSAAEIYDQVVWLRKLCVEHYGKPLTNIVYMGMGEPLLNYKNMLRSTQMITTDEGLGMAAKRITVSTAGIAKMIRQLGDDKVRFNLALSLHAANDEKRNTIMEINQSNNLDELADALRYFYEQTGNRITFEYIVFDGFNDTKQDALELVSFCKRIPGNVRVNIIEYNPIDEGNFAQASADKVDAFKAVLERNGITSTVRRSRGKDIDAACGQLANKNKIAQA